MIDRKEIELLIRAQLQGGKDLATVTKSIAELEKAIDEQAAAAKRGETSIDDLKASLLQLKVVQEQLTRSAESVGAFQKLTKQVEATEARVGKAGKALTEYQTKLAGLSDVTDKQQDRLVKLQATFDRAGETLGKQQTSLANLRKELVAAGVDTNDLAGSELKLRDAAAQLGVTLNKGQQAIASYADDVKRARVEQQKATSDAAQFAAAEKKAADATRARAKANAEYDRTVADRKAQAVADARAFDQQAAAAQKSAQAAEFVRRWAAQLDELDKANGLRKQADDAEKASQQYSTLARAATNLAPKVSSVRDAVNQLINPSKAATQTLAGVENQVTALSKSIQGIKGPVKDAQVMFASLRDSQNALASQAGLIDTFRKQADALRAARTEMSAAKAQVSQYAAEVRKGGDAGASFSKSLSEAQARVRAASEAISRQLAATRQAREALRAAGIETNNLAAAEQRLVGTANAATTAVSQLTEAVKKNGTAQASVGKGSSFFGDEGRTTLSLMQRLRGQVLALAAAYTGLQGAVTLAGDSIDQYNTREGVKNQLGISIGNDRQKIDEEYAYIKAQADRIGVVFANASRAYAKFSADAALAGRSRQEIRYIAETFLEVGRVANLTTDELDGVFKALGQVYSKGKIQAEELRGQLGDRLFGAFQIAAKALKDQFPDLDKALEKGLVTSEQLTAIAEEYRRTVANQLPAATQSLAANQARLTNAVNDFKLAVADSGFADAYLAAIKQLTEFLKSDDGAKFAESVSTGFTALADALVFVLKHLDEIKAILSTLIGLWAANAILKQAQNFVALGTAIKGAALELSALQKGFLLLSSFIVGWNIGSYVYDKFKEVRIAGAYLVASFDAAWTTIKYNAQIAFEAFPEVAGNAFKSVLNTLTLFARKALGIFATLAKAAGADDLAAKLGGAIEALTFNVSNTSSGRVAQLRAQMAADLKAIKKIFDDTVSYENRQQSATKKAASNLGLPTDSPGATGKGKESGPTEAEIKKRANEIEAITRALETLDAKIDRSQTDTLSKQLEAVDTEYQALKRRIEKLGGQQSVEFLQQLETSVGQLKLQITRKFNDKLEAEQRALLTRLEQNEAAAGRKNKSDLDARLEAVTLSYAETYRDIADLRNKLLENGRDAAVADEMERRAKVAEAAQKELETQKFYKDQLAANDQRVNDLLTQRAARIKSINDLVEAGLITQLEADEQIKETVGTLQPQIEAMADAGIAFAESLRGAFDPVALDTFIAKLEYMKGSANGVNETFKQTAKTIEDQFVNGAVSAFDQIGMALGEAAAGTKTWEETVVSIRSAFLQFAADFLRMLAQMILKQMILNALKNYGGGWGQAVAAAAGVAHSGGMVGSGMSRSRSVPADWFANAPRYHAGGVPGLAADEFPAILQRGEEVITKDSPRNVMNGGKAAFQNRNSQAMPKNLRFVLVDDRDKVAEAMNTPAGEEAVMHIMKRNVPTLRTMLRES